MKPTEFQLKIARNAAARIFAEVKWKVKIKNVTSADIVRIITDAIDETNQKVRVAEIRDEAVRQYERMISMVNAVAGQSSPRFHIPQDVPKPRASSNGDPHETEA